MSTFLKPIPVRESLLQKGIQFITPQHFEEIFHTSPVQTKYFLEQQTKEGLFLRLKKGLYALRTDIPAEELVANHLYRPSYLSFEYALARYNILPEMTYEVTSATTKPTRTFEVQDAVYTYLTIKTEAYTGYTLQKEGERAFFIAEPEKALVDYMYFVALGKKTLNERLYLKELDSAKVYAYANLFQRPKLNKLLSFVL